MARIHGLQPLDPPGARLLVLGSFPSRSSLELGQYYGHDRNQFWELMSRLLGQASPVGYPAKQALLAAAGIAVWDLIASCEREGSLDKDIREEELNPLLGFLAARKSLRAIALNGGKAASAFVAAVGPELGPRALPIGELRRWEPGALADRSFVLARLPSTSPVPTREFRCLEDKLPYWRVFLDEL